MQAKLSSKPLTSLFFLATELENNTHLDYDLLYMTVDQEPLKSIDMVPIYEPSARVVNGVMHFIYEREATVCFIKAVS